MFTRASNLHMHSMLSYSATRKNFCILVVDLSFLKKAPLLRYVVQNLLVAIMRTLPQITMPPDSLCCYVCGAFGDLCPVSDEMKRSYQSVHPVCNEYSATGKKERTRGPRFTGRKRKATESGL